MLLPMIQLPYISIVPRKWPLREDDLTWGDIWTTVNAALWLVHLNISSPVIGWGLWQPSCSPTWDLWAWPDSAHFYANEVTWLMINGHFMQMSCQKYWVIPIYGRTISWRGRRLEIFMNELWPLIFFLMDLLLLLLLLHIGHWFFLFMNGLCAACWTLIFFMNGLFAAFAGQIWKC